MNIVFDCARHVKVDHERYLPDVAQTAAEGIVHYEDALRRLAGPTRGGGPELGDDLLTRRLAHVLVQREGFDGASAELVSDRLDGIDRSGKDDLQRQCAA